MIAAVVFFVATTSATHCTMIQSLPGDPVQPSPGWQKVVCGRVIDPSEMTPEDRLQGICDMAESAKDDLQALREQNKNLQGDLEAIRAFACAPPKTK